MIKLFDYKFLITLGLSLVVYFLYREVDILNKRVAALEKTNKDTKPKKLIELPPPPPDEIPETKNELVEEYSNDGIDNANIYSHDNLETNSNDHDTLMVDSILNMVRAETPKVENSKVSSTTEKTNPTKLSETSVEKSETNNSSDSAVHIKTEETTEQSATIEENENNNDTVSEQEVKLVKTTKFSMDALNKKKLDELQELATTYGIDINNENGKKKRKVDLAQEIFNIQ